MFRFVIWLTRRLWSSHEPTSRAASRPADLAAYTVVDSPAELVTVRLPDGRLVEGERADARGAANGPRQNPTLVLMTPPGGPRPTRVEVLADFLARHFAKGKKKK